MKTFTIENFLLHINLKTGPDIKEITRELQECVTASKIKTGLIHAFVVGSTGSITTIEYEPGVVSDLKRAITSLAPPGISYEHEKAWHDGNGHSHVQAALIGPSLTLPVRSSSIQVGTWQQVVVINHDNGPRKRDIEVTITGRY